jgi:NADH dehydrogenase
MASGEQPNGTRHRVVVIGSGFGGLFATRALRRAPVDVTLIDRTNHHLFQPLLYQLATGILSEGEIAPPTREILRRQKNARTVIGEVTAIDLKNREISAEFLNRTLTFPYDSLIVAAGSGQSYFGNDGFAEFAPSMKSIDDALELRARIFGAFEVAELTPDEARRRELLTFVVVGAGPTGVEMAGQLAELSRRGLAGEFRTFRPEEEVRVILVEAGPRVLNGFGEQISERTRRDLGKLGIDVRLDTKVVGVDRDGVEVEEPDGTRHQIRSAVKVWAAGVAASSLGGILADTPGVERNRNGQVAVEPDCSLHGHPEVFVVGDMMQLPGKAAVAQVAIQSGRHAARRIVEDLDGKGARSEFHYHDKGMLATISRFRAVAAIGRLRVYGFPAWVLWLVVHLLYLIGFRNRVSVVMHWTVSFLGRGRAERAATEHQARLDRDGTR